jgi:hypothetical protein
MFIDRPTYPIDFKFPDVDLQTIAAYIRNEVNITFSTPLGGKSAISSYTVDNTNKLPLGTNIYPLLKIFRNEESFLFPIGAGNVISLTIAYVLSYKHTDSASGLTHHVAKEICRILQNSEVDDNIPFTIDKEQGIIIRYESVDKTDRIFDLAKINCAVFAY